ncbi:MAG: hypothetical protein BWX58_01089 [Deltaproteobacteria bacterium ADurb.Bin026]|nr:MAG: hypothetical protein BWX58_01089 [Deltaproteobacteria bacterium ADurb.Bin026]
MESISIGFELTVMLLELKSIGFALTIMLLELKSIGFALTVMLLELKSTGSKLTVVVSVLYFCVVEVASGFCFSENVLSISSPNNFFNSSLVCKAVTSLDCIRGCSSSMFILATPLSVMGLLCCWNRLFSVSSNMSANGIS